MVSLTKGCLIAAQLMITAPMAMAADYSAEAPVLPTAHKAKSKTALKYDDMDYLLEKTILPLGRSEHRAIGKADAAIGTRISKANPKPSRLEGNRVMFHFIQTDAQKMVVKDVRDTLLELPSRFSLEKLSRNEQLAYWLNLHNAIVLAEVADRYPVKKIDRLYGDCNLQPERFACARSFELLGQKVSVTDIQNHVLENWNDPLVIYGFYMGAVGTPNIRTKAFSGDTVYDDLESNAVDFVNSIRGTRMRGDRKVRVSEYYEIMGQKFPNFSDDILRHLKKYARGDFKRKLDWVVEVETNINDWYIADLYNGNVTGPDGANVISANSGGLAKARYPLHVKQLLNGVLERHKRRRGQVVIETMERAENGELEEEDDEEIEVAPNGG